LLYQNFGSRFWEPRSLTTRVLAKFLRKRGICFAAGGRLRFHAAFLSNNQAKGESDDWISLRFTIPFEVLNEMVELEKSVFLYLCNKDFSCFTG
jgi:hypothetical protein